MQPGNVAQDGTDRDSPYTEGLAETIVKPGPDVFQAFNQVGLAVKKATGGAQGAVSYSSKSRCRHRWAAFAEDWLAALGQTPAIRYFKMKEAMRVRDQFEGFDEEQRNERIRSLVEIITRHAIAGFISVIPSEPFIRIMQGWGDREYLNRPYFLLFHNIIVNW